ncbi:MAG: hypothetical protein IJJ82_07355 [Clostridia bacterium]|nr:hypothetical protein [Clostridia bacterium]
MNNDITKVQEKINKAREKMDMAIANNENYSKILDISISIDSIINEYLAAETNLIDERRNLMTKYDNLINTPFKDKIINQIRKEVRQKFHAMGIQELLQFSTNVYIYSTLKAHNIPEQDVVDQLIFLNNKFLDATKNDDEIVIGTEMDQSTLEYLTYIADKYTKIIKERI